jgi:AcrR family transcriptional regulator
VFVERAIDGATIDDVTDAAGAAKGTFYLYFRTKDELVSALRQQFSTNTAAAMQAAPASATGDRRSRLPAILAAGMAYYCAHAQLHDALFHLGQTRGQSFRTNPVVQLLERFIETEAADSGAASADPGLTAVLLRAHTNDHVRRAMPGRFATSRPRSSTFHAK